MPAAEPIVKGQFVHNADHHENRGDDNDNHRGATAVPPDSSARQSVHRS